MIILILTFPIHPSHFFLFQVWHNIDEKKAAELSLWKDTRHKLKRLAGM